MPQLGTWLKAALQRANLVFTRTILRSTSCGEAEQKPGRPMEGFQETIKSQVPTAAPGSASREGASPTSPELQAEGKGEGVSHPTCSGLHCLSLGAKFSFEG